MNANDPRLAAAREVLNEALDLGYASGDVDPEYADLTEKLTKAVRGVLSYVDEKA